MNDIPFEVTPHLKYENPDGYVTARPRKYVYHGRWSITFNRVITDGTRYFKLTFELPATEYQSAQVDKTVNVDEVYPFEKNIIDYKIKPT